MKRSNGAVFNIIVILVALSCAGLAQECLYDDDCAKSGNDCCCSQYFGDPKSVCTVTSECPGSLGSGFSCTVKDSECVYNDECSVDDDDDKDCCCSRWAGDTEAKCTASSGCPGTLGSDYSCTTRLCKTDDDCAGSFKCCKDINTKLNKCLAKCEDPKC